MTETEINLPFIAQDSSRSPVHLTQRITRSKFEQLVGDLLESSIQPCRAALSDAKLQPKDIDEVWGIAKAYSTRVGGGGAEFTFTRGYVFVHKDDRN
jgi:hypothetical protein